MIVAPGFRCGRAGRSARGRQRAGERGSGERAGAPPPLPALALYQSLRPWQAGSQLFTGVLCQLRLAALSIAPFTCSALSTLVPAVNPAP